MFICGDTLIFVCSFGEHVLLETHGHSSTHAPCSSASPLDLVRQARAKALQGIIITEHLIAVGKGDSDDLKRVMRDAEKALENA